MTWRRRGRQVLAALLLAAASSGRAEPPASAAGPGAGDAGGDEAFVAELQRLGEAAQWPGFAVALVDRRGPVFERGFGWADVGRRVPYTSTTIQPVASVSKTVIGVCLMHAIEQGWCTPDSPVGGLAGMDVVHPRFGHQPITLRQLATHTSGIVDSARYRDSYAPGRVGPETLRDFLASYVVAGGRRYSTRNFGAHRPGTAYEYTNMGASLAALALETKAGVPFSLLAERVVFARLGMGDSAWAYNPAKAARHSVLYDGRGRPIPAYTLITYPDGGLHTTCHDLALYLAEMIRGSLGEGQVLARPSYATMFAPQFAEGRRPAGLPKEERNVGLFWSINAAGSVGHTGGDPGVASFLYFNPERHTGIIFVANTELTRAARTQLAEVVAVIKRIEAARVRRE